MSITKYDCNDAEFEDMFLKDGEIYVSEAYYNKWFIPLFENLNIPFPFKTKRNKILDVYGNETYLDETELFHYISSATDLHKWYDDFSDYTFKTVFYRFSDDEMIELRENLRFDIEYKGNVHKNLKDFMLNELEKSMEEETGYEVDNYFVKLTSVSNHQEKYYTIYDTDELLIDLVKGSRTWTELDRGINVLCFREYKNADYSKNEFRCFIYNSNLTAISQYIINEYINYDKNYIRKKISKFIKKINIPYFDCVIDILLENNKCTIVEIGRTGHNFGVGSCCFNWNIDRDILYSDGSFVVVKLAIDVKNDYEYTF